jgi:phosphoesterase RecJ-like protein
MALDWAPFVEFIRAHERFLLTTHVRPDADGLGSMKALALALTRQGKDVRCLIASVFPPRYRFLDPESKVERFVASTPPVTPDAVIVLDTGTWNQLGDFGPYLREMTAARVVIDHHQTQDDLGALCFVDVSAEATGRLAYEAVQAMGVPVDAEIANALFVALAMDTGWYRHSNARAATFELAGRLVAAGARPEFLYERLFEECSLARMKLTGLVLDRLEVTHGGLVAHTELRLADYQATGATPQDSEDLVNFTRSLTGVEVGVFFMEQPRGGVKISFRSRAKVDVARLAEQFGGGGHRLASGAIIQAPLEQARARVLEAIARVLPPLE